MLPLALCLFFCIHDFIWLPLHIHTLLSKCIFFSTNMHNIFHLIHYYVHMYVCVWHVTAWALSISICKQVLFLNICINAHSMQKLVNSFLVSVAEAPEINRGLADILFAFTLNLYFRLCTEQIHSCVYVHILWCCHSISLLKCTQCIIIFAHRSSRVNFCITLHAYTTPTYLFAFCLDSGNLSLAAAERQMCIIVMCKISFKLSAGFI